MLYGQEKSLLSRLSNSKTEDGGIALFGNSADLDITAMAVQAMAPYQNSNPKAKAAVDRAIAYMKNKMSDKAGFVGWGSENSLFYSTGCHSIDSSRD